MCAIVLLAISIRGYLATSRNIFNTRVLAPLAAVNIKLCVFLVVLYYAARLTISLQHRRNHTERSNQILELLTQRDNGIPFNRIYEIKAVKSSPLVPCTHIHICIYIDAHTHACKIYTQYSFSLFYYGN